MAGIMGSKKKLSINLSFLTVIDSSKQAGAQKAPKNFKEPNGVVGLRILAALNDDVHHHHTQDSIFMNCSRAAVAAISCNASPDPVPILSTQNSLPKNSTISMEEMELCEEYTCVISHLGENLIKKREYFEADFLGNKDERVSDSSVNCGGEIDSFLIADFLSSCFLCKKRLHGLDIFMYRGENAFCSVECRYSQMTIDEQTEKYKSGARKTIEYSVSPCSGTLRFFAGVAAA